ncbi:hypothetical protein AGLY_015390 [Aphis glycines]|uniref:Uncharacterized protein n=1 Tax=Aphis glycines TaxID=307491 RepID=A0A6G0T351_APHGL|nr:hypothetical protein AGLY_015390 [Aphis glycines]
MNEMSSKSFKYISQNDTFIGFEYYGSNIFENQSSLKYDNQALVQKSYVTMEINCGLIPKDIICDQGSNNIKMRKLFKVTIEKPYITYINEKLPSSSMSLFNSRDFEETQIFLSTSKVNNKRKTLSLALLADKKILIVLKRLTQDFIECLFSTLRLKGGNNVTPDASTFFFSNLNGSVCGIEPVRHLINIKYQSTILNSSTALLNYLHNKSISSKMDELHAYQTCQKEIKRQNIKGDRLFREHNENSQSVHQSLFKELINLLPKYDTVLKKHLLESPKHAQYTNSFISMLADETNDVEKIRPINISVIAIFKINHSTGNFNSLCVGLDLMNKHWENILSICFDGASTMSRHLNGV